MKTYSALLLVLSFPFAAQEASAPVSVENEPLHHVVLKNESVVVMHLTLPPGERTLYHTHSHDRVAIPLSTTSITQQVLNEKESAPSPSEAGSFSALTLAGSSYTHRVHNVGAVPYDVLDVELLERPRTPSLLAAAAVAAENPSACAGGDFCDAHPCAPLPDRRHHGIHTENEFARRPIFHP